MSDEFAIEKNFDFGFFEKYSQVDLTRDVRESISGLKLKEPFILHRHVLGALLANADVMITSPPATGKSSLLSIALFQLLNKQSKTLQFLILEGMEHLVVETYQNLSSFCNTGQVRYCVAENKSPIINDYKAFKSCQIGIAGRRKMLKLLRNTHRSYESLRFVILDAVPPCDPIINEVMQLLSQKAPQAKYWSFNKKTEPYYIDFCESFMHNPLKAIVKINICDIKCLSHFYVPIENDNRKIQLLMRIIRQSQDYQKVIFIETDNEIRNCQQFLESVRPGVILERTLHKDSMAMLKDFEKNVFNVLICPSKQYFARRISTGRPLYSIIFNVVSPELYCTLCRRSGDVTNDRVYTFTKNNDEVENVEEISTAFGIKIQKWPSLNDE